VFIVVAVDKTCFQLRYRLSFLAASRFNARVDGPYLVASQESYVGREFHKRGNKGFLPEISFSMTQLYNYYCKAF
jgi:hypothetical protein